MNGINRHGYQQGVGEQKFDHALAQVAQAKMQAEGQISANRDRSPVEMALDQLQKVIEAGHAEMLELRDRLIPVMDQGGAKTCAISGGNEPQAVAPSQIEGRIAHMVDRVGILQGSLHEMRVLLRI